MSVPLAPANQAIAAAIVEKYRGRVLTVKAARDMTAEIAEAIRYRTGQMLTYGPDEVTRIAQWAGVSEAHARDVIAQAGGNCVSAEDVSLIWAQTPRPVTGPILKDVGIDRNVIAAEIKALLHASRDGMRKKGVDTKTVGFSLGNDGGYSAEAFGILRGLKLLGYGFFGAVNDSDPNNLKAWLFRLEREVLDEEHFGSTNECDHCLERYGKDAAGRTA